MTKCLLIASTFPPLVGGTCVVYDNLCRFSSGQVIPLVPYTDYHDGRPIEQIESSDLLAPYKILRHSLVRPRQRSRARRIVALGWLILDIPVFFSVLATVARIVWREKIDVICIGELTYCGWLIIPCKYLLRLKTVVYVHGEELTTSAVTYAERAKFPLLRAADAAIAVSEYTRKTMMERAGVDPAKIHVVLNGVNTEIFRPAPPRSDLVQRYGLAGRRVILSVGRLVERKGTDNAIRAIAIVRQQQPDIRYLIVGDGPFRPTLNGSQQKQVLVIALFLPAPYPERNSRRITRFARSSCNPTVSSRTAIPKASVSSSSRPMPAVNLW